MLSFFRRGITAKIMLVVLGIGLFAIVITGFGTGGSGGGQQREGRADCDVDAGRLACRGRDAGKLAELRQAAVHFPVPGNELAAEVHRQSLGWGKRGA